MKEHDLSESWRRTSEYFEDTAPATSETVPEIAPGAEAVPSEVPSEVPSAPNVTTAQLPRDEQGSRPGQSRAARVRARFESDPRTQRQLGCVVIAFAGFWIFATVVGAAQNFSWLLPFGGAQIAFAIVVAVAAVAMLGRGLRQTAPQVVLEVTDAGLRIGGTLARWEDIAQIELVRRYPIPPGSPAGVLSAVVSMVDLDVRLEDGSVIPIPRDVLGTEPLGPWDVVIEAIRLARPALPIVDSDDARPSSDPAGG